MEYKFHKIRMICISLIICILSFFFICAGKKNDIYGIWTTTKSHRPGMIGMYYYIQFKKNGSFNYSTTTEGMEDYPVYSGNFWINKDMFYIQDKFNSRPGIYKYKIGKNRNDKQVYLTFILIEDSYQTRIKDFTKNDLCRYNLSSDELTKLKSNKRIDEQYMIYLPENYISDNEKYPLLLFLHGFGEKGDNLELVKKHGPLKLIDNGQNLPFVVVAPQLPSFSILWSSKFLDNIIIDVSNKYRIDEDRIYVTGLSIGGAGTWTFAMEFPDRLAAIAPICGFGDLEIVHRIKDLPVWVFHGAKDNMVSLSNSELMVNALKELESEVKFTIYPDADHDSWTETYNNPELYIWLLSHKRNTDK